jgi:hypothetical protein
VTLTQYDGMVHPFFSMGGAIDMGRTAQAEAAAALKDAFGQGGLEQGWQAARLRARYGHRGLR